MLRLVLILSLLLLPACTTRDDRSWIHPHREGQRYESPMLDLAQYQPPQQRVGQDPKLSIAVAISGGGERAANFAAGVFIGLERIRPQDDDTNALTEIDYASTVSGGGMAMGVYIASLHDHITQHGSRSGYLFERAFAPPPPPPPEVSDSEASLRAQNFPGAGAGLRKQLERSYTDDLVEGLLTFAVLRHIDRGDFLEKAFNEHLLGAKIRGRDLVLGDLYVDATQDKENHLPFWAANTTCFENGAIFPFTPDMLAMYQVVSYTHNLKPVKFDPDLPIPSEAYDHWLKNIPVALAVRASGNFPGAVPATTLGSRMDPINPWLHLYDGGLADNLGVLTAIDLLRQELSLDQQIHSPTKRQKVLFVIDAYQGTFAPFSINESSPTTFEVAMRVTTIALDSWHARHRLAIHALADAGSPNERIHIIYFNFEDLDDLSRYHELFDEDFTEEDLQVILADREKLLDEKIWSPFRLARSIATSYNVTPEEQRFLIAAGKYVVRLHEDEIRATLAWE